MSDVERLLAQAERHETRCGEGRMVWHAWGAGPTVVLLHGGYGSWRHWVRNIDALAAGHRVLAADLPGLGESDLPPQPTGPDTVGAVLSEGLAELVPEGERYDLVGFSFGGVMSGGLALRDEARLRSLTLVGSGGLGLPGASLPLVSVRGLVGEAREAAHRENLRLLMIRDPARIDTEALAIQDWNTRRGRTRSPEISRQGTLRLALERLAGKLDGRVNGIWGEYDQVANGDVRDREALLRALCPGIDFRVIRGAGHWVMYEAPEAFNAALLAMLARR